jgi:hypothetical protein
MLFTTDGVEACLLYGGFLIAPLPTRKQLWEARDAHHWQLERQKGIEDSSVFGIKIGGQMAKFSDFIDAEVTQKNIVLAQPQEPTERESDEHWTQWCSCMDQLGALVMLAASLRTEP